MEGVWCQPLNDRQDLARTSPIGLVGFDFVIPYILHLIILGFSLSFEYFGTYLLAHDLSPLAYTPLI